jgi:Cu(I)/Ag(I) efflux system membrane fusion protein
MAQVRLRFPLVLLVAFVVVGRWEDVRNGWLRLARVSAHTNAENAPISENTEYFCPMDPGVVSNWPGRCGVCNMALVRRKKGEAVALPDGVVSRMQISPYRLQLAGIRTQEVDYRPLARAIELPGRVTAVSPKILIEAELSAAESAEIRDGASVEATADDLAGMPPVTGTVKKLAVSREDRKTAVIELNASPADWHPGMPVRLRATIPIALREPFRSQPSDPPERRPSDPKVVFLCPDHPEAVGLRPGRCAIDKNTLEKRSLAANERVGWWCPMHPKVESNEAGKKCLECGGMELVPRIVHYRPSGQVLAVPESAVIDTGKTTLVYVERMPGMFDGVPVFLGPRCGDDYPVVTGLLARQRVAARGAFLIDAETRLNPSVGAAYFGAGRGRDAKTEPDSAPVSSRGSEESGTCPVTKKPLGSMGPPVTIFVDGRKVRLCCAGCEAAVRKNPAKYLDGSKGASIGAGTGP